ncbi:MAG: polysaccharide export protein EpsE [Pseudomonadota bacterium]
MMRRIFQYVLLSFLVCTSAFAQSGPAASPVAAEPIVGPGDVLRITVFQNPDLSVETRVSELGQISFPLIGNVSLNGLSLTAAQDKIAKQLRDGGFVVKPQVSIALVTVRSNQVSILGQVAKPGRYPIDAANTRVSEMVAAAGGVLPGGSDVVSLVGNRNGKPVKYDIDLPSILQAGRRELDVIVANGDILHVDREQKIFIYGEVQKPGSYRWDRSMTVLQAMAQAGGLTQRGTERGIRIHRRDPSGTGTKIIEPKMIDPIERDDVIYVRESVF